MSEPEDFLARWSRRKREAAEQPDKPTAPDTAHETSDAAAPENESAAARAAPPTASETEQEPAPQVDLASLPPIESIDATTDIRAFLQAGVPADLTRAALRRVWTSDPTIRNFIGIAENQWDFAAIDGVPGFGPLKAVDDVRRMVAEISDAGRKLVDADEQDEKKDAADAKSTAADAAEPTAESRESAVAETTDGEPPEQDVAQLPQDDSSNQAAPEMPAEDIVRRSEVDIAMQQNEGEDEYKPLPTRRPHGRALPE